MTCIEEIETQININQADMRDGYFSFGTSHKPHWNMILKRVGEENLVDIKNSLDWWSAKVPKKYLSLTHLGIKSNASIQSGRFTPKSQTWGQVTGNKSTLNTKLEA